MAALLLQVMEKTVGIWEDSGLQGEFYSISYLNFLVNHLHQGSRSNILIIAGLATVTKCWKDGSPGI